MLRSQINPRAIAGGLLAAVALLGLLINNAWPVWLLLLAIGIVLLTVSLTDRYEYECQKCHGVYKLGIRSALTSRHGRDSTGSWAISRCPHCGAITKARESLSNDQKKI
jgi:hypothetical protein